MKAKFKRSVWPKNTAHRIQDARASGASWQVIADDFGCSLATIRNRAIELGLFEPKANRRFTAEDDAILRADYLANADLEDTAKKIGCSYGVLRQRINHKHKDLLNTVRTSHGTKQLKRYGLGLLEHGFTADEAAKNIKARLIAAKAAARVAAISAKERRANQIIEAMLADIAGGKDRNVAIFETRALGISLQRIADHFDITRERVRQICDAEAFRAAINTDLNHDAPPVVQRDILYVGSGSC